MNPKALLILGLAVVLGIGAMMMSMKLLSRPAPVVEETQEVLVAARDFREEEIIKADMVATIRKSKKDIPAGAFSAFKDIEDRWVKTAMIEGDPIVDKKLGPKGSSPGLVANIPKGMRAFALEVNEQSGVSGFILPGHHVDVIRVDSSENGRVQRGETILQDVLVLAAGQVFTRPEEKALQSRTVTLAVTPEQVDVMVAARGKGALSLSLRGVNDHEVVSRPGPVQEEAGEDEKEQRLKLERELAEVKDLLAKKMAESPPAPPPLPPPPPDEPKTRWVYVYRPLADKKNRDYPERVAINAKARTEMVQEKAEEEEEEENAEASRQGFGFGGGSLARQLAEVPSLDDEEP